MKTELKSKVAKQLKIVEGQIRGLQKMVEEDQCCIDVITQISAVRHSLSSIEGKMLESHLHTCVAKKMQGKNKDTAIAEILAVYKLAKKSK